VGLKCNTCRWWAPGTRVCSVPGPPFYEKSRPVGNVTYRGFYGTMPPDGWCSQHGEDEHAVAKRLLGEGGG